MDNGASTSGTGAMARVSDVLDALDDFFPWELAGGRAPGGLLLGSGDSTVTGAVCAVDLTEEAVEATAARKHDLLLVHHPQLLTRTGNPLDWSTPGGRVASRAAREGISIIACYQNAEIARGGACDLMAGAVGLRQMVPLIPTRSSFIAKVVVFVPPDAVDRVAKAMSAAGAGVIGDYTQCSFRSSGTGTFVPGISARPYSGKPGELNLADEVSLEMVCPSFRLERVRQAMKAEHPYQEVAFDTYRTCSAVPWGMGRVGELETDRSLYDIAGELEAWSASEGVTLVGEPGRKVRRLAVVPGPADRMIARAVAAGAQALAAGEAGWHAIIEARESGIGLITIGHLQSDRALVGAFVGALEAARDRKGWKMEIEGLRDREGRWC
ncbi:MAG TPA: Nif3-like dinuclear metal center hexameric protein [Candidatus Anoxymicrobiaceae bacterium]